MAEVLEAAREETYFLGMTLQKRFAAETVMSLLVFS